MATQISNPAPTGKSVFWDEQDYTVDNGGFGIAPRREPSCRNLPTSRHNKSGVLSFMEGHAEGWRWRGTSALKFSSYG
jgi:hypothetical protein